MNAYQVIPDRSMSIIHGPPLLEEPGLGELSLPGFLRQVTEHCPDREALVRHLPNRAVER